MSEVERKKMKINFTKKQYDNLLKLCYIGNWMANAQRTGAKDDPIVEKYEELNYYLKSLAPEFGLENLVQLDKKINKYFFTRDFEEAEDTHGLIDEYDENSFWDDLIDHLVDRDFAKIYSQKEREKMSLKEFMNKRQLFGEKWNKEIYDHGIMRLDIKNDAK